MIKVFNAFQLVCLFACLPFLIGWLWSGPFPYSIAAFVVAVAVYIVMFAANVGMVADEI